jgi:predicted AlkP superfamily pyrophosphatase or phosphodiesterase
MKSKSADRVLFVLALLVAAGCAGHEPPFPSAKCPGDVVPRKQDASKQAPPRLVVWLTVDQMRGDYLQRYSEQFSDGGFHRLQENGVTYQDAHYAHAITETAPGHATLFTGASPKDHGIVANSWMDASGREVASVRDETAFLLGPGVGKFGSDPAKGRSPRALLVETIFDAALRATGNRAKLIAISSKDRGAILPAGHHGKAFWLGTEGFVSSTYYGKQAPAWLFTHHERFPPAAYLASGWILSRPASEYKNSAPSSPHASKRLGVGFPHRPAPGVDTLQALGESPFGDVAVIDLALTALEAEALGQDDVVDFLALSLSSTDFVGHHFGPESIEMEDQMIRLDDQIARLLAHLETEIGLDQVLLVLSSDHGGSETAEYLTAHGKPATRITEAGVESATRATLKAQFGNDDFFLGVASPYVYLNRALIAERKLDISVVRRNLAISLTEVTGIHRAVALGDIAVPEPEASLIREAMHPDRSGDLYIVPDRHSLFLQEPDLAATHGSPWNYDTHVPIILSRGGFEAQTVSTRVDVRSLAPTVAELAGIAPPLAAEAKRLPLPR